MAERIDKPNFIVPLANSYNPRGNAGYTQVVTNELDQRKINLYYEVSKNSLTGETALSLALRPGARESGAGAHGTSGQSSQAMVNAPGTNQNAMWVFSTLNDTVRASNTTQTTTFLSAANYRPTYVDKYLVNNVDTVCLQIQDSAVPDADQRTFYASTISGFTEIVSTFSTFLHTGKMEFMDGYGFILDRSNNRIQNSNLNTLSTWPSGNFITKQITQDRSLGLAKLRDKILAFGDETVEIFYNGGLTPAPLLPIKYMHERIGLSQQMFPQTGNTSFTVTDYYTVLGNRMYFLGTVGKGYQGLAHLMSFDGSRFEKVSPPYIDKILQEAEVGSISAMTVNGQKAIAITITLSSFLVQRWLMYFPEWNDWFEWTSNVYYPINIRGFHLGIRDNSFLLFTFAQAAEVFQDYSTSYSWLTQFKIPSDGSRKQMRMYGVIADTARATDTMNTAYSDDDGQTWVTSQAIDLSLERKLVFRGGPFVNRFMRLSGTTSTQIRLHKFVARII